MKFFELFKKSNTKLEVVSGIEYKYTKKSNAKNIKISIKGNSNVNVTIPSFLRFSDGKNFVLQNKNWILDNLSHFDFKKIDENFKTKTDNLLIVKDEIKKPIIKKEKEKVYFIYPSCMDFYSNEIQLELKKAIKLALHIEAKNYLPKRISSLAIIYGFKFNKIYLKALKSRWGSCSFKNNINLNINLMTLDNDLIDYVLIHELAHTVEKNHKKEFWALVYKCLPDAKNLRKRLKNAPIII